ncbi:MAG: hypothetical protein STSR0009_02600 [Methanoregula sp.]
MGFVIQGDANSVIFVGEDEFTPVLPAGDGYYCHVLTVMQRVIKKIVKYFFKKKIGIDLDILYINHEIDILTVSPKGKS